MIKFCHYYYVIISESINYNIYTIYIHIIYVVCLIAKDYFSKEVTITKRRQNMELSIGNSNSSHNNNCKISSSSSSSDQKHYLNMEEDVYACDGKEDEILFCDDGGNDDDIRFDKIVGIMQDILLDSSFRRIQEEFCAKNCEYFEDTEENKLIYTDIFNEYTQFLEKYLENEICDRIGVR